MKYLELIESIRTIRDFKDEAISNEAINKIIEAGYNSCGLVGTDNIKIQFIQDGKKFFEELGNSAGYFGNLIEAPHYLIITSKLHNNMMENSGYIMEAMRLKAWELGIGSCWLSIEDSFELRSALKIDSEDIVTSFLGLGYQYKGIFKTDMSEKSDRLGIEDLVYKQKWGEKCMFEDIESRGLTSVFYYSKFAPSWGNLQPWRFILCDDKIILTMLKDNESNGLDAGIMMLYLEKAAYEAGFKGKWILNESNSNKYNIPDNYTMVGFYNI